MALAHDPTDYFQKNLKKLMPGIPSVVNDTNPSINNINVNIGIEKVMDYNDFITQFQNDKQTERIVQAMTVDRMMGKNTLNKYNVRVR